MDTWFSLLKITSIIAAGLFGALGLLTNHKDETGKVTRWGRIALGGILLSSSISVILYALETSKAKAAADKAKAEANATAQLLQNILTNAQMTADQQKRTLDETNVLKLGLEETLKQQRLNLQRSDYIAKGMESSLVTQQSVLSGNERILGGVTSTIEKQGKILGQTTTTLYDTQRLLQPLGEIQVSFRLDIGTSPNTSSYLAHLREEFKRAAQKFSKTAAVDAGQGIVVQPDGSIFIGAGSPLLPQFKSKEDFLKLVPFYINFYRAKVTPSMWNGPFKPPPGSVALQTTDGLVIADYGTRPGPTPDLQLHVLAADHSYEGLRSDFDRGENLTIKYRPDTDSFSLEGSYIKAGTWFDNGGITSVLDLPGSTLVVEFLNTHEELTLRWIDIKVAKGKQISISPDAKYVVHGREFYFYNVPPKDTR